MNDLSMLQRLGLYTGSRKGLGAQGSSVENQYLTTFEQNLVIFHVGFAHSFFYSFLRPRDTSETINPVEKVTKVIVRADTDI